MKATTPCEHCHRKLYIRIETDGMGGTVEVPELCQCGDARWSRGECAECGVRVKRKNPARMPKKRCPKHDREHRVATVRRYRERHGERVAKIERDRQRERYQTDPRVRLRDIRRSRERYSIERKIRQRRRARKKAELQKRNQEIARRYRDGERDVELAEPFGLAPSSIRRIAAETEIESERQYGQGEAA